MNKYIFAAVLLSLAVQPALAQSKNPLLNPSGTPVLNPGKQPVLAPEACRQIAEYQPDPGAHVAYEPDVDVHGKPVAGANLKNSPVTAPRVIQFSIDADVAQYAGIPLPEGQNLATVGVVEVDTQTGDMNFNGKPIEGPALAALKSLCSHPAPPEPAPGAVPQDVPGSYEDDAAPDNDSHNQ